MQTELKAMRVEELNIKTNNIQLTENAKIEIKPNFVRQVQRVPNNDKIQIIYLQMKIESAEGDVKPFDMLVRVSGLFETDAKTAEETRYFMIEATQTLYPYLRSSVSMLLALGGHPSITLPSLKGGILFPEDAFTADSLNVLKGNDGIVS